jgi:hypothetical protein
MPKNRASSLVTRVPFKFLTTFNSGSSGFTASNLDLQLANMGGRLSALKALFKRWRLISLKVKGLLDGKSTVGISAGNAGVSFAVGFYGSPLTNISVAVPSALADIITFLYSDIGNEHLAFVVPKSALKAARSSDWLVTANTGSSSADDVDVSAGSVLAGMQIGQTLATGSVRAYVVFTGVIELCDPTTTSVSLSGGLGVPAPSTHLPSVDDDGSDDEKTFQVVTQTGVNKVVRNIKR